MMRQKVAADVSANTTATFIYKVGGTVSENVPAIKTPNYLLSMQGISLSLGLRHLDDIASECSSGTVHALMGENGAANPR